MRRCQVSAVVYHKAAPAALSSCTGGASQLTTIGRYPVISLGDARQRAKEILAERVLGRTRVHSNISFEEAVAKFLDIHEVREHTKADLREFSDGIFSLSCGASHWSASTPPT